MLDDDERRILADLEQQFQVAERPFPAIPVLCAGLFICVPLVMLLFGWPGVVIVLDLFAAAVAVVLIRRRRSRAS